MTLCLCGNILMSQNLTRYDQKLEHATGIKGKPFDFEYVRL